MSDDVYPYDVEFRRKIIALCLQPGWFPRYGTSLIQPEYFELDAEKDVVDAVVQYYQEYDHAPRDPEDLLVMCNGQHTQIIEESFTKDNLELAQDAVIKWAKEQAAKIAILDSIDDVKSGDLETVAQRIKAASLVGEDLTMPGLEVIEDVNQWLYQDMWERKIPTGLLHVDRHLDGGVAAGEMMIVMAPSNRGKSMALVNIAYGAAGMGSGKDVAIFTLEMSPEVYAKRFGARMLHRFPTRKEDTKAYKEELLDKAKLLMPGKVRIIGGADRMTTAQMEGHLRRLVDEGFVPDMVVCDYPDLMVPPRRREQRRFELSDTYEWLRSLGAPGHITDEGFPTIGASQSNRGSFNKEVITEQDIAEDIGKVAVSDIIAAICQTRKEAEEERCRIYLPKVRDGARGAMFNAKYYGDSQAIITTGISKRNEDEDA